MNDALSGPQTSVSDPTTSHNLGVSGPSFTCPTPEGLAPITNLQGEPTSLGATDSCDRIPEGQPDPRDKRVSQVGQYDREYGVYSELDADALKRGDQIGIEGELAEGKQFVHNYADDGSFRTGRNGLRFATRWGLLSLSLWITLMFAGLYKYNSGEQIESLGVDVHIEGGRSVPADKVELILGWEVPTKPEGLLRFLATTNFVGDWSADKHRDRSIL